MSTKHHRVIPVSLPRASEIGQVFESVTFSDAFSIELPAEASNDPELLARFIFAHQAPWVHSLMKARDALVAGFGLKTAKQLHAHGGGTAPGRVGIFRIYRTGPTEVVLGEDDKHLDFRLSVLCTGQPAALDKRQLILSTVVHCHNRSGRIYIALIAPFHCLIVQSGLRRAARIGWPSAKTA